jgi:hypothetical protein
MTVALSIRRSGPYTASGGQTAFDFTWQANAAGDIVVTRRRAGVDTVLGYPANYTLAPGSLANPAGGQILLVVGATAGDQILIEAHTDAERATAYADERTIRGDALNAEFDKMQRQLQEVGRTADRALPRDPFDNVYDAGGRVVRRVAEPVAGSDVATKNYVDNALAGGVLDSLQGYVDEAQAWAENDEDDPVEPGMFSAKHHAAKAAAEVVEAEAAAAAAAGSAGTAAGAATAASGHATAASGHASAAALSAAEAAVAEAAAELAEVAAEAARDTTYANARAAPTWAALAAISSGLAAGERGEVFGADAGTHTDPVVGGTVANEGIYAWSTSPAGWRRLGARNDLAAGIPQPSGFVEDPVIDPQGRMLGIRDTGEFVAPALRALSQINGYTRAELERALMRAQTPFVGYGQLPFDDNLIVFAGQSHMNGAGGAGTNASYPVLSTAARGGLIAFGPQIMQSLDDTVSPARFGDYIAAVEQGYTRGGIDYSETPARGCGDMILNLLERRNQSPFSIHQRRIILCNLGNGNTLVANWLRDGGLAFANETSNWGLIEKAAQQGKIKSAAAGRTFGVLAVAWSQGASDYTGTSKADYKTRLLQFTNDLQTYVKGHTGQRQPVFVVVVQNHSHASRSSALNPYVAEAQAEAAEENPLIVLAHPQYADLYGYSGVHHNNKESRRIGGQLGACIYRLAVEQRAWWNFLPAAITRHASDVIRVRYDVPSRHKLTWIYDNPDSMTVANVQGFRAEDNHGFHPVDTGTTTAIALATGKLPWIDGDSVYIRTAAALPATLDLQYARGDDNAGNLACVPLDIADVCPLDVGGNTRELVRLASNFRKVVP